eukprot:3236649-Rhodomonas_salina.2
MSGRGKVRITKVDQSNGARITKVDQPRPEEEDSDTETQWEGQELVVLQSRVQHVLWFITDLPVRASRYTGKALVEEVSATLDERKKQMLDLHQDLDAESTDKKHVEQARDLAKGIQNALSRDKKTLKEQVSALEEKFLASEEEVKWLNN